MKTEQAQRAEELLKSLPEDVRNAVESMQRATRVRRVYASEERKVKYVQII